MLRQRVICRKTCVYIYIVGTIEHCCGKGATLPQPCLGCGIGYRAKFGYAYKEKQTRCSCARVLSQLAPNKAIALHMLYSWHRCINSSTTNASGIAKPSTLRAICRNILYEPNPKARKVACMLKPMMPRLIPFRLTSAGYKAVLTEFDLLFRPRAKLGVNRRELLSLTTTENLVSQPQLAVAYKRQPSFQKATAWRWMH